MSRIHGLLGAGLVVLLLAAVPLAMAHSDSQRSAVHPEEGLVEDPLFGLDGAGLPHGVRVIDISQPASPREIGLWIGEGAPADAPAVDIWSVVPHGDLLLASDRNFGLYILKLEPAT